MGEFSAKHKDAKKAMGEFSAKHKDAKKAMGEFSAKYKDAISATKKKQWVSSQLNTKMQYLLLGKSSMRVDQRVIYLPSTCSHEEKAVGSTYWESYTPDKLKAVDKLSNKYIQIHLISVFF